MQTLDKIFHHVAFTTFWFLVIALLGIWMWYLSIGEKQDLKACMDKGHSYEQCVIEI